MWKTEEGSTGRLLQLCTGYFLFYVITGVTVKYFQGPAAAGYPGMAELEFLAYSTFGGTAICLIVVFALRWFHLESIRRINFLGFNIPSELLYIVPSGVCTAVVIPTTTLMYSLGISVMVAMVIMRGAVIVISRAVDEIQIRQGILQRKLFLEENIAVLFALGAVGVVLFFENNVGFNFMESTAAVAILSSYIAAYSIRIYIMNYFKNTRPKGAKLDNNGFFAVEQIAASITMAGAAALIYYSPELFGWQAKQILVFKGAIADPKPLWGLAVLAGVAYGFVAFFSVFIFMFKGRSATFAGLVNRLTSLVAGTAGTIISYAFFGGKFPGNKDWLSLGLILIAVVFLALAERKRAQFVENQKNVPNAENSPALGPARVGKVGGA